MVNEGGSPGTMSVLELDPYKSKFFIGGVPDTAQVRSGIFKRLVTCL